MLDGHIHRGVPLKGQAASEHLVEHHAGGIEIRAAVDPAALGLLWGDIVDGAQRLLRQSRLVG